MNFAVRVPGSCGELLQGSSFLVTCPIDVYTTVAVSDALHGCKGLGRKAQTALQLALRDLEKDAFPWGMCLTSDLPQGKGMASSSADIAAVIAAVQFAFTGKIDAERILQLAVQIEPTDGTFLSGIIAMNPKTGKKLASYGSLPAFRISIFDIGGTIDTQEFYQKKKRLLVDKAREQATKQALAEFEQGVREKDEVQIAQAMTKSAFLNQQILFKPDLEYFWQCTKQLGASGINVAHSGTVIGVFWSQNMGRKQIDKSEQYLQTLQPKFKFWRQVSLRPGGIFLQPEVPRPIAEP